MKNKIKNFNVILKVEQLYTINVDAGSAQEAADMAQEDYELGNQDDAFPDETHWVEEVRATDYKEKSKLQDEIIQDLSNDIID
jgi:hypothetical protein|tara:strand:+ start:264 stop:512 length:249 start_codon:yes stop_codon:yes gene_type:complete